MTYKKERIKYIDTLKFLAILAIIGLHMFQLWTNTEILNFNIYKLSEITRFGVPVFLMVSGALLLNKKIEVKSFFKKRFARIILPLLFYTIISLIILNNPLLKPFWYCWMIIGVYLTLPIINIFIEHAKIKEIEYFIIFFIFTSILYEITSYFNITQCLDLNFFIGPVSYLILGYYLSIKKFKFSAKKIIIISIILFILSTIIKIKYGDAFYFNHSPNLMSRLNLSFPQIIQASSMFIIIKYLYEIKTGIFSKIKNILEIKTVNSFILSVSRASYGMYLLHTFLYRGFLEEYVKTLNFTGTQTCIFIILSTIGLFLISWLVVLILGQIPYIKKLSGYY